MFRLFTFLSTLANMFNFFKKAPERIDFQFLGIDIHSHLLPGLDDGSANLDTSIALIADLHEAGFHSFICTPHIFMELYPNDDSTITPALQSVQGHEYITRNNIKVAAAAEYMTNIDFLDIVDQRKHIMTLPGNYVLIEMSYIAKTPDIENYIFKLNAIGYKPILAHPERYLFYHGDLNEVKRLKDLGCLLQLNLLSATDGYGRGVKKAAISMLEKGWYDLAATDCHHHRHINGLKDVKLWGKTYKQVKEYPFKNMELFQL